MPPTGHELVSCALVRGNKHPSAAGILVEHWDVIQNEATEEQSQSKAPIVLGRPGKTFCSEQEKCNDPAKAGASISLREWGIFSVREPLAR